MLPETAYITLLIMGGIFIRPACGREVIIEEV